MRSVSGSVGDVSADSDVRGSKCEDLWVICARALPFLKVLGLDVRFPLRMLPSPRARSLKTRFSAVVFDKSGICPMWLGCVSSRFGSRNPCVKFASLFLPSIMCVEMPLKERESVNFLGHRLFSLTFLRAFGSPFATSKTSWLPTLSRTVLGRSTGHSRTRIRPEGEDEAERGHGGAVALSAEFELVQN